MRSFLRSKEIVRHAQARGVHGDAIHIGPVTMFVAADMLVASDLIVIARASGQPEKIVTDKHSWLLLDINIIEIELVGWRHVYTVPAREVVQLEQIKLVGRVAEHDDMARPVHQSLIQSLFGGLGHYGRAGQYPKSLAAYRAGNATIAPGHDVHMQKERSGQHLSGVENLINFLISDV